MSKKFLNRKVLLAALSLAALAGCGKGNSSNPASLSGGLGTNGTNYNNGGYGGTCGATVSQRQFAFNAPSAQIGAASVQAASSQIGGGTAGPWVSQQGPMAYVQMCINRGGNNNLGGSQCPQGVSGVLTLSDSTINNIRAMAASYYYQGNNYYNGGYGNGYNNGGYGNGYNGNYGGNYQMPEPCISNFAFSFLVGTVVYGRAWLLVTVPGYNGQNIQFTYPMTI